MNLDELEASRTAPEPPAHLPPLLMALWWDARNDWDRAHAIAQDVATRDGAWVHAYLHRREGDPGNAAYWYRQAGRPVCRNPLLEERREIATALLDG